MKDIKPRYYWTLAVFILFFLAFAYYLICWTSLDIEIKISQLIQAFIGFAAISSSIIAFAISDKKTKQIKFLLHSYALSRDEVGKHPKLILKESIRKDFESFPETILSHQVYFKITNLSGFTLNKPTITIRLSKKYMHPDEDGNYLTIRSNLFNSQITSQILNFAETIILSNSNLNYLNDREAIKIWIRVCLPTNDDKGVNFRVALNSEDAEGRTFKIKCTKVELLNATENNPIIGTPKD